MYNRLDFYLKLRGMKQVDLIHLTGLYQSVISNAVRHGLVSKSTKERIADALGIPVEELWPESDES